MVIRFAVLLNPGIVVPSDDGVGVVSGCGLPDYILMVHL